MNMKENMLKPIRQAVGLEKIPVEFTNNPNESANACIKSKVDYKKSELNVFCAEMKELVDSQTRDIERAFTLDTGPYAVSPPYHKYKENPRKWVKESKAYRQRVLHKVHKLKLIPQTLSSKADEHVDHLDFTSASRVSSGDEENSLTVANISPLSISWKEIGLAEEILGNMWDKAASLVADNEAIVNAPGLSNSKMVVSYTTPKKPHLVTMLTSGKVTCDCLNYSTKSLCSHSLAVAQRYGVLAKLLQWYTQTNQQANFWSLARSSDVPKQPGSKRKRSRVARLPAETSSKNPRTSIPSHKILSASSSQSHFTMTSQCGPSQWTHTSGPSYSHSTGPSQWTHTSGPSYSHSTGPSQWTHTSGPFPLHSTWLPQWPHYFAPFPCYPYGPTNLPDSSNQLQHPFADKNPTAGYVSVPVQEQTSKI